MITAEWHSGLHKFAITVQFRKREREYATLVSHCSEDYLSVWEPQDVLTYPYSDGY